MTSPTTSSSPVDTAAKSGLTAGQWVVVLLIMGCGLFLMGWTAVKLATTPAEQPNIAKEAERFLRFRKSGPLSEEMTVFLSQKNPHLVKSQEHPLIGQQAPNFTLKDPDGKMIQLDTLKEKGPVIVVFYYGYWCDHCVAQLFGINEDLKRFHELGAEVIAISADPPELTRERFEQYGKFNFPVVSDPRSEVAEKWSVFQPAKDGNPETLFHGTFVVGPDGKVEWADLGDQPFLHNQTLLFKLAELQGRMPGQNPSSAETPLSETK